MSGKLWEWKYNLATGVWLDGDEQKWTDGSPIAASLGIGVASAWIGTTQGAQSRIAAAIPNASPAGQIELAFKNSVTGRWERSGADVWSNGRAYTNGQPGIAYVPFDQDVDVASGCLYISWSPSNGSAGLLAHTEGNSPVTSQSRRLLFADPPVLLYNVWTTLGGNNVALMYDMQHDTNMRAAFTFVHPDTGSELWFMPMADGVYNGDLKDQDDYNVHSWQSSVFVRA